MSRVEITAGPFRFSARLEERLAPETCRFFLRMLPLRDRIIHVRWSGEGCWIPMGELRTGLPRENTTSQPVPGQAIFYPGGESETEILLGYGTVRFAANVGPLSGNHFLTITDGLNRLPDLGRLTLWYGAQDILIDPA